MTEGNPEALSIDLLSVNKFVLDDLRGIAYSQPDSLSPHSLRYVAESLAVCLSALPLCHS